MPCKKKSPRFILTSCLVAAGLAVGWGSGLLGKAAGAMKALLVHCLEYIQGLDPALAALTFIGLYVVATIFFFPGLIITMAGGVIFGPLKGTLLVSIASVIGCSLSFLIGRYLARGWISRKTADSPRFQAIDQAVGEEGGKIVFLMRLSPVFPYNLLNYSLGLTRVKFRSYLLASWLGMLPGTLMYVYLGSLAGNIASLAAGTGPATERSASQWILFGAGLLATIVVSVYVTRLAKRALDQQLSARA